MDTLAKGTGLTLGLALAVVLVLSWRVPADGAVAPAEVSLVALPAGELEQRPLGTFMTATLRPGDRRSSRALRLRNITPLPLDVQVRLVPSSRVLDRALRVRLDVAGHRLAAGSLGRLRRWSAATVRIQPAATATLAVRVAVPAGPYAAEAGGQDVDVSTELRSRPVGTAP